MDAECGATKIVDGVLRRRSIVLLTPLAKVAARAAGVSPATTAAVLGVVARAMLGAAVVERLTVLGTRAAERFNQVRGASG